MKRYYTDYAENINAPRVLQDSEYVAVKKFVANSLKINLFKFSFFKKEGAVLTDVTFTKNIDTLKPLIKNKKEINSVLISENIDTKDYVILEFSILIKKHFIDNTVFCLPFTPSLLYGYEDPIFIDNNFNPILQIHEAHSIIFEEIYLIKPYKKDQVQILTQPYFGKS
ncbi:hypothetical protein GW755_01670 [bacterium]|nr:hypothetical protein [bacterium]